MIGYNRRYRNPQGAVNIRDEVIEGDVKRAIIEILASNKNIDFYKTQKQDSTLNNYVNDAKQRVSFLDSHKHDSTGYGHTVDGRRVGDDVFVDVAVLYNEKWNGNLTYAKGEDLIFAMRHRPFDVSVGFCNERIMCSIDGHNMMSDDCEHLLGERVKIGTKEVEAIGEIEDGHLTEVSLVYDGATPGCESLTPEYRDKLTRKVDTLIRNGKATRAQVLDFCRRIRIPELEVKAEAPEPRKQFRGVRMAKKTTEALESQVEELTEDLDDAKEELTELRSMYKKDREQIRELKKENKALRDVQTQIQGIENEIRTLCVEQHVDNLEKEKKEVTEDVKTRYVEKVKTMGYEALRAELAEKTERRDIIIAMEKKDEEEKGGEGDPDTGDPADDKKKEARKVLQPFVAPLRSTESSLLGL